MDIGKMDKRIKLITNKSTGSSIEPQEVTVWAKKNSIQGNEFYASYQSGLSLQLSFTIRKSAYELSSYLDSQNIKHYAAMVEFENATYNILRAYGPDEFVELICN